MSWPSVFLYDDLLEPDSSVASHLLRSAILFLCLVYIVDKCFNSSDLAGVELTPLTSIPLIFIDTAGCDMAELDTTDEESKGNESWWCCMYH